MQAQAAVCGLHISCFDLPYGEVLWLHPPRSVCNGVYDAEQMLHLYLFRQRETKEVDSPGKSQKNTLAKQTQQKHSEFSLLVLMDLTHMQKSNSGDKDLREESGETKMLFTRETDQDEATPAISEKPLEPCPDIPPNLQGVLYVEFRTNRTLENVRQHVGPLLQQGGRYKPANCVAKQKVAIIIPFRNRYEHLSHWLHYLHPILIRQQLDYGVYVINQEGDGVFNKAKLMNIGHTEALKDYDYECFVFSDIDLVPLNDRNLYRCSDKPRHLSVAVDKFNFTLPYNIFGGRIFFRGMSISRPDSVIGRYKMIKHGRDLHNNPNPNNVQKLKETPHTIDRDGLNSLSYTVRNIRKDSLYTFITVDVQAPAG
ncbi:beta-1,4-galactosyltransferase 1-like [Girardinichthys multiradiatus]|uniref:beta-1,4-galactosyltransferase 1-like n=1 Tax=Girardinichthys multiradiatus TaxID=208333 RepID=UPI001FAB5222|nr:beta-1,4-galactosyltransferase 1-like [Girardinichthys multiradiatus]